MQPEQEQDRYELRESPPYQFPVTRREFIEVAGIVICLTPLYPAMAADTAGSARITMDPNGIITVRSGKVEFGQGARTEIAMAVAEELQIPLSRIRVILGDTELCPNDGITAGSRTTPSTLPQVHQSVTEFIAQNPPAPEKKKKILGTSHGRTDAKEIVTGTHLYPSDIRRPGMLYGCVLRAPAYGWKLKSIDGSSISKMKNVHLVQDQNFAACCAATSFEARQAVERLAATANWTEASHPSHDDLPQVLKQFAENPREQSKGSVQKALETSQKRIRATYQAPYIQHAPMEPRAAVAEWNSGKLTIWTGTQNPFGVQQQLQQAFHLPENRVRVIVPDTGGGFGGKHTGEVAIEAARLAKEVNKPVSLRWTRAEEFMWAYFRPAALYEIEAAIDADGKIMAWDYSVYNAGMAGIQTPYRIENVRTRFFATNSPLREGSYRGIAATANNYSRECMMDELAHACKQDPLDFRLNNLENPRLRDVLIAATDEFNWKSRKKSLKKGSGIGLACGVEKGSYIATCVEIELQGSRILVKDVQAAYECGRILNPSNVEAQVHGAIIQGLGGALTEEIQFRNGRLLNGSFSKYPVPRFSDVPPIRTKLLDRPDLTSVGASETPIITIAPAIVNALFQATGERTRSLPVKPGRSQDSRTESA